MKTPLTLKVLEAENAKLKKLLAEAMLDNTMLKDVASKKWERPAQTGSGLNPRRYSYADLI
ncbi:hypothetical protein [Roseibium sp. Sym1]|uniref:hypothetical protein n=1 Tax=Roseibium sp. Sym1 TaxID=3016006 RepID=UPI003FA778FE